MVARTPLNVQSICALPVLFDSPAHAQNMTLLFFLVQVRFPFNLINRTQISITVQQVPNSKFIIIHFRCNSIVFTTVQYQRMNTLYFVSPGYSLQNEGKKQIPVHISPFHTHSLKLVLSNPPPHTHTHFTPLTL